MSRFRPFVGIFLFLVTLPLFAGNDHCGDIAIASLTANDAQLSQPVTIAWSYSGAAPVSQTLSISWAGSPALSSEDRSYIYQTHRPGTYNVRLTASSQCGTAEATTQFFIKNCYVAIPVVHVSSEVVNAGDFVLATTDVPDGHTAEWSAVSGGTLVNANGGSAFFTAGSEGPLQIEVVITNDKGCSEKGAATVGIYVPPPPPTYCYPYIPIADEIMWGACPGQPKTEHLYSPLPEGATVVWSVDKGEILSGQGTDRITYIVQGAPEETYTVSNQLVFPDGCKSYPYTRTEKMHGAPSTSISVPTPSIHAGESTTIYLTTSYVSGGNFYAENGDSIEPIYQDTPQMCCSNNVYPYKYTSTHGPGVTTIRSFVTGMCGGTAEASATIEILP